MATNPGGVGNHSGPQPTWTEENFDSMKALLSMLSDEVRARLYVISKIFSNSILFFSLSHQCLQISKPADVQLVCLYISCDCPCCVCMCLVVFYVPFLLHVGVSHLSAVSIL